jgi:Putative zinc-finger
MNKTSNTHSPQVCGRQAELVAYLYNEATGAERAGFEQHLPDCADCRNELRSFQSVRDEMSVWQVPFAPRIEIALRKSRWQAMRDLLVTFPAWARLATAGALTAAAALVFLSLLGTSVSVNSDGVALAFGRKPLPIIQPPVALQSLPLNANLITRDEAAALIQQAVAEATAQTRGESRIQMASLEERLTTAHQAKLAALTKKLHDDQRQMMASAQPSLREWLFAANEEPEAEVNKNEKSN